MAAVWASRQKGKLEGFDQAPSWLHVSALAWVGWTVRLLVAEVNEAAIRFYLKNGFQRAGGIYKERIDENFVIREYGFEKEL